MGFKRLIIALALLLLASSFFFLTTKEFTFEDFYFDTYVKVKIYSHNPIRAKKAIEEVKAEFMRIDTLNVKGIKSGVIDTTTKTIIEKSLYFSEKTNGYFDPTIDPILHKWNYFKNPVLPAETEIESLLPFVNFQKVKIKGDTLIIPEDFSLNIGGSAKGYALNRAKKILQKYGIQSALIEVGGDILLLGKKKGRKNWIIGIRNPREENGIIGTLEVCDCFVFTSGDYERYFELEGKRYHHIVNPFTGYPSKEIASATVIVKDGIEGDCITTAIVAMEKDKAVDFISDNKISVILVDTSENIHKFINEGRLNIYE